MVKRNPINQTPASFPPGLFTNTSSRISHNAALPTWLLLASVFSAGWSANGNFNNARSCWSGLSNTRPLLPLLRLECSPLPEWWGSGMRTDGVTGRGWKESAKGRGRKRRMEAGGRVRIGNREQGSAKKMQVFILSWVYSGGFYWLVPVFWIKESPWLNTKQESKEVWRAERDIKLQGEDEDRGRQRLMQLRRKSREVSWLFLRCAFKT